MDGREYLYNVLMGNPNANNAIGRTSGSIAKSSSGNDNFFAKRFKSIDNAIGTTGAALADAGGIFGLAGAAMAGLTGGDYTSASSARENQNIEDRQKKWNDSLDDIAKKYGYGSFQGVWDARDAAESAGDTAKLDEIDNGVVKELQAQTATNSKEASQASKNWEDYRKNSDVGKRVNQDRGKFAGSAINTLSTAFDVLAPGAGVLANSVQGGIEGVADELEQNGLENFNAERAAKNAVAGVTTGAVVGGLNKGISNSLAKRGGNLFKGGNAITRGLNNLGSQTALGRAGSTIATGVGRGALSGAVGGATGAGVSAAMNNQDVLGSALQGASQGLQQGALAGGVMAGAGLAGNTVKNNFSGLQNQETASSIDNVSDNLQTEPEMRTNPQNDTAPSQTRQDVNTDLMYGESNLGNRTRRGMVADSLERFGNTLEGAQTNVTRAATKDLGIESTGKVIENVRKKTGLTNLETQAQLARELTGGADSLMDNVQRMALTASEDGKGYKVDTTNVMNEVDAIVDKYADTNMFGSMTARNKFISNLKRDISNLDSDVLSIANRMKSNAADLRGRGVASPSPADSAKAKIYTEVANRLDDLSYKAIPQDNVEALFGATISEMRGRANQAAQNGNNDIAKAYTTLADSLDKEPRTIKAYRSFKKDFVDTAKIADLTAQAENGAAVQMGRGFGSGLKRFTGTLLQRPVNATLAKVGGAVNSLADRVAGEPSPTPKVDTAVTPNNVVDTVYNPATQVYNAIGRTEGLTNAEQARTANYLTNAVQEAQTVPETATAGTLEGLLSPNSSNATSVYDSVYGTTPQAQAAMQTTNTGYFQPTGDYWTDILASAMSSAIDDNDVTAFTSLYGMYQDAIAGLEKAQSSSTAETKLTDKQRQANAAERALNDFEGAQHNFAYDVSDIPLIGGIANLGGNEYASKAEALALQIGYMLSGATVNKEEAKNIGMAYVPQPRDNEAVRQSKLAQLRGIISDYQKTYAE